jgi:hypothetical protein
MAKTFTAPFAQEPKTATAVTTLASVIGSADSPTNTALLLTAGADGAIVTNLSAMPRGTASASSLLLFLSKDGGTTQRLIDSELMPAFNLSSGVVIPETQFARYNENTPLRLEANDRLYVASQVALAAGIVFKAEFTNY